MIGFAGFICCFHRTLCSAIFCVAHAADTPIASVTLAVPETARCCQHEQMRESRETCYTAKHGISFASRKGKDPEQMTADNQKSQVPRELHINKPL